MQTIKSPKYQMKKSWATEIKGYRRKKLMKLTALIFKVLMEKRF